jgi:hypothetical protein
MIDQSSDKTSKYRVTATPGGWRLQHDECWSGPFASPADAIDQACRLARSDAVGGRVAIVTTDTVPQEFHCYAPPLESDCAPAPGFPAHLRLISNR